MGILIVCLKKSMSGYYMFDEMIVAQLGLAFPEMIAECTCT